MTTSEAARRKLLEQFAAECAEHLVTANWPADDREAASALLHAVAADELTFEEWHGAIPAIVAAMGASAAPAMALRNFDRFLKAQWNHLAFLRLIRAHPEHLEFLARVFAGSQFLSDILVRNPEYLDWLFIEAALHREKSPDEFRRELDLAVAAFRRPETRRRALCRYKRRELLRIGVRDILDKASLDEQIRELSALAQAACGLALADSAATLVARHGLPTLPTGADPATVGFLVVAMGKFGGEELNYSSDIDLNFLYGNEGTTAGRREADGSIAGRISHHEFYCRLASAMCQYLGDPTNEGILLRVDTRLRPEGNAGPLACSVSAYASYFADRARSWEKVAYLKARAVAGDALLADRFHAMCQHFLFTGNRPENLFPEIARMKHRIDGERLDEKGRRLDIKRGPGGIREIEFIAAGLQLLHGTTDARFRIRGTVLALELLAQAGHLTLEQARRLSACYRLFRKVEHWLQMMEEQQTHALPDTAEGREVLAARLGYGDGAEFERLLDECRTYVRAQFESIFHPELEERPSFDLLDALEGSDPASAEAIATLKPFRLGTPEGFQGMRALATGTAELAIGKAGRRKFARLLPSFLEEFREAPFPEAAAQSMAGLLRARQGISAMYDMLEHHPPVLRLLARVLGNGGFASRILTARPEYLDELIAGEALDPRRSPRDVFKFEWSRRAASMPAADALALARRLRQREGLFIAVREILNVVPHDPCAHATTELAHACLEAALTIAQRETGVQLPVAFIALGSFGARHVHLFADLDVAVFYDEDAPGATSARAGDLASQVIAAMSAVSPDGMLWKMDARLRPDGASAPLAVGLARADRYYRSEAGVWEFQSLLRARFAAGDSALGDRIAAVFHGALESRAPFANLENDIYDMRVRIDASAKVPKWASVDLKRSPGGLHDIEFLAQYLRLRHFVEYPALLVPETEVALATARDAGLIAEEDASALIAHYGLLRTVQRAHRLLHETARDYLHADAERRGALARALRWTLADEAEDILADLPARMTATRRLFARLLGRG